jgi:hypothetical protein
MTTTKSIDFYRSTSFIGSRRYAGCGGCLKGSLL